MGIVFHSCSKSKRRKCMPHSLSQYRNGEKIQQNKSLLTNYNILHRQKNIKVCFKVGIINPKINYCFVNCIITSACDYETSYEQITETAYQTTRGMSPIGHCAVGLQCFLCLYKQKQSLHPHAATLQVQADMSC